MVTVRSFPRLSIAAFCLRVARAARLPAVALLPVLLLGLFGASRVLPEEHRRHLDPVGRFLVPAEVLLVAYVGFRLHRAHRAAASASAGAREDPLERIRATLQGVLPAPAAATAVAHEVALLWYALFAWRARPDVHAGELGFSGHRRNGYGGALAAAGLVAAMETMVVHLLVQRWSPTAAWVLTAASLYGLVWLLGHFQAVRLRPVLLAPDALHVRIGLLWSVRVPYGDVAAFGPVGAAAPGRRSPGYLHAVTLGRPHFLVELRDAVDVQGIYGYTKRNVRRIGLAPDERERFGAELARRLDAAR